MSRQAGAQIYSVPITDGTRALHAEAHAEWLNLSSEKRRELFDDARDKLREAFERWDDRLHTERL